MRVALGSIFRDAAGPQLDRYFRQALALRDALEARGDHLRLILVEGDSADDTHAELLRLCEKYKLALSLRTRSHGGQRWGSVVDAARFRALAWVANGVMEQLEASDDVLLWVESDLTWDAETLVQLADEAAGNWRAVAPLVCYPNGQFYDIWAFRVNGPFQSDPPYHPVLEGVGDIIEIDSAGSCLAIDGPLARKVRFPAVDAIVGLCGEIREQGGAVFVDKRLTVTHPLPRVTVGV